MEKSKGFATLAAALTAAAGPADGVVAFITGVIQSNLLKFFLVQAEYHGMHTKVWMHDDGDMWSGESGWRIPKHRDDVVHDTAHASDFLSLDWKRTSYYVENGKSGWLNPNGEFWGCNYAGHGNLAHYVIRKTYLDLERDGWVHVDEEGKPRKYTWRMVGPAGREPTSAQEAWLAANGHDLDPAGKRAARRQIMLNIGGVQIDADADKAAFERMMASAPKR